MGNYKIPGHCAFFSFFHFMAVNHSRVFRIPVHGGCRIFKDYLLPVLLVFLTIANRCETASSISALVTLPS